MVKTNKSYLVERIEDLKNYAKENNLSSILVYARGSATGPATKSHGYMRYLCNWDGVETDAVLIIYPNKDPLLLVTGMFDAFYAEKHYWMKQVRYVKIHELGEALVELLANTTDKNIGLIGMAEMPVMVWLPLTAVIPQEKLINIEYYLDEKRIIKNAYQLEKHQTAAQLCDHVFATLKKEIVNNKTGYQLQAELEKVARYEGAEYCSTWLTIAPQAQYSHLRPQEGQQVPQPGDQVLLGMFLLVDGYWGHAIRTGYMSHTQPAQQQLFDVVSGMQQDMLEQLVDGCDLSQLHQLAEHRITTQFPDSHETIYRFRHGHGLGHSYEEPITNQSFPQLSDTDNRSLSLIAKQGMLFELHPNLFVPNLGGAVVGDMVVVTEQGNQLLTHYPRHHINWAE